MESSKSSRRSAISFIGDSPHSESIPRLFPSPVGKDKLFVVVVVVVTVVCSV